MKFHKIIAVLCLCISGSIYAGDASEIWSRMYKRSITPEIKYSVMLGMVELNDPSMAPLFHKILVEDIIANLDNKRTVNEESNFIELAKLVAKELGELKYKRSSELLYQLYLGHPDALVKSECLMALGRIRATEYIDDIAYILHIKNTRHDSGRLSSVDLDHESRVAFAAISALDRFRHIDGYSSVFFASLGWYTDRVTNYADKVLLTITENPIEALIPILEEGDFVSKKKAGHEVYRCNAPKEDKIEAARVALVQGHDNIPGSIQNGMVLTSLRKKAIYTTWFNKSTNPQDVTYLERSVRSGDDLEEKLYAIKALGVNATDEAIESLTTILHEFNERNASGFGITYQEEDVIREIITTLGETGNPNVEYALMEVIYSGYTDGIVRRAKKALDNLG